MNQSPKLSLFLDLGCSPMKDVVLKCKNRMSIGTFSLQVLEDMFKGITCEYIEVIPERLIAIEAKDNLMNLYNDYGEIEAVKDIEVML